MIVNQMHGMDFEDSLPCQGHFYIEKELHAINFVYQ